MFRFQETEISLSLGGQSGWRNRTMPGLARTLAGRLAGRRKPSHPYRGRAVNRVQTLPNRRRQSLSHYPGLAMGVQLWSSRFLFQVFEGFQILAQVSPADGQADPVE